MSNGKEMQVTHDRWVESGRCNACGMMPMANNAPHSNAAARVEWSRRQRRAATHRTNTGTMSMAKNQKNKDFGADRWGSFHHGGTSSAIACSDPSRCPHDGGRGSARPG